MFSLNDDFCAACLSAQTGLPLDTVERTVSELGKSGSFLQDRWKCNACGRRTSVIRALSNRLVSGRRHRRRAA